MNSRHKFVQRIAPFGLRHEIAKRYTPLDWYKSLRISNLIRENKSDELISNLLDKKTPGLVGRLGGTEARFLGEYYKIQRLQRLGISRKFVSLVSPRWKKRKSEVFSNAGFYFDSWEEVDEFASLYATALTETDILGAWGVAFTWVEGKFLESSHTDLIPVGNTAPWVEPYQDGSPIPLTKPWMKALRSKKVLVISAFSGSIEKQHKVIDQVFPHIEYPKFELKVLKAPMTAGQRDSSGKTWVQLLSETKSAMDQIDFDVALVAAGAFSYPLAQYAKQLGKIGIHCGGGLQLFFGIMGNRWNNSPEVLKYLNESWIRPNSSERPKSADNIEGACYW